MFSKLFSFWEIKMGLSKFLQMRLNSFIIRFLPFSISRFYLAALGQVYFLVNQQEKKLIRKTICQVFRGKIAAGKLRKIIKETFRGIFDHYHEKLFLSYYSIPKLHDFVRTRIGFQGREKLQEALQAGKGVILVTGHFGAVEFLPGALAVDGFPTSMICRFLTTSLRESLGRRAEWVGLNLIDAHKGSFLAAMKALKEGRILITECDEFEAWRPDSQRDTSFLNYRLTADRTLEILHQRSGAPVVTAMVTRDGQKRYTCNFTAVGRGAAAPANMPIGEQCLKVLETWVESHPEQWYQWTKFGKMIETQLEVENDHQKNRYLSPETGLSVPDQA